MASKTRLRGEQSSQPLTWLGEILWPDGRTRFVPGGVTGSDVGAGRGRECGQAAIALQWWASPNAADAEILIPAGSTKAARTAVRRYHDGFSLRRRAKSLAAESIMCVPALAGIALGRHLVTIDGPLDDGVLHQLADLLSQTHPHLSELHVAVSLARPKSNRKPVLQLIDQDGECLGWAKVGWNDWTRELVANEAAWLAARPIHPLITPELVSDDSMAGHRVVVAGSVSASRWPQRQTTAGPAADLLGAIANLGSRACVGLADTPWWASVQQIRPVATPSEARAIEKVAASAEGLVFDIGAWHGDLTPWNIMSRSNRSMLGKSHATYQVIDWEFAADGVPIGFDLCHYHTQVGAEMKGMSADQALDYSARLSPQGLARLGVDPHNQLAVYRLYLIELVRRTLALRAAGLPVDDVHQGAAAVRRIKADLLAAPKPGVDAITGGAG